MITPDRTYLIDVGDEIIWCDSQTPADFVDVENTCAYIKLDLVKAAFKEAAGVITELCTVYGNPLPEATLGRLNGILEGD